MLKKDSRMYQDRMEDILKQMEQVIEERNKVIDKLIIGDMFEKSNTSVIIPVNNCEEHFWKLMKV